jgi:hypothetical protein
MFAIVRYVVLVQFDARKKGMATLLVHANLSINQGSKAFHQHTGPCSGCGAAE